MKYICPVVGAVLSPFAPCQQPFLAIALPDRVVPVDSGMNKADDLNPVADSQGTGCSKTMGKAVSEGIMSANSCLRPAYPLRYSVSLVSPVPGSSAWMCGSPCLRASWV